MNDPDFSKITGAYLTAREVVSAEIFGLSRLAATLDHSFDEAINIIRNATGRVIISGLGKSGHVGRKLAATFASTGQPAYFVHAAEAGHGDLGMIAQNDVLILISYSGEAKELTPVIDYAHRFSLPIISITGKQTSTLARFSTVALVLPEAPEACPMGLAPTTSSTMTLALGDALAIALLKMRGFTPTDFKIFHPGGNLGQQLRRVADFMQTGEKLPLVQVGVSMQACLPLMTQYGLGCVGVVNDKSQLCGVITDGDLRRHFSSDLLEKTVDDVMTQHPVTISSDMLMADALALLQEKAITSLFVIDQDDQGVLGLLHIHDCLRSQTI